MEFLYRIMRKIKFPAIFRIDIGYFDSLKKSYSRNKTPDGLLVGICIPFIIIVNKMGIQKCINIGIFKYMSTVLKLKHP